MSFAALQGEDLTSLPLSHLGESLTGFRTLAQTAAVIYWPGVVQDLKEFFGVFMSVTSLGFLI